MRYKGDPDLFKGVGKTSKFPPEPLSPEQKSWIHAHKVIVDGMVFDSVFEATRWKELKLDTDILNLQAHYVLNCEVNGVHVCRYTADFYYINRHTGKKIIEETKGYWTDVARLRFKLAQACYPELEFKVLSMRPPKKRGPKKGSTKKSKA